MVFPLHESLKWCTNVDDEKAFEEYLERVRIEGIQVNKMQVCALHWHVSDLNYMIIIFDFHVEIDILCASDELMQNVQES